MHPFGVLGAASFRLDSSLHRGGQHLRVFSAESQSAPHEQHTPVNSDQMLTSWF